VTFLNKTRSHLLYIFFKQNKEATVSIHTGNPSSS
jgi:hypothetical protein